MMSYPIATPGAVLVHFFLPPELEARRVVSLLVRAKRPEVKYISSIRSYYILLHLELRSHSQ